MSTNLEWGATSMLESDARAVAGLSLRRPASGAAPDAVLFRDVTKSFGATRALDGVSMAIPIGSTIALLGPNGAGKSTAIHLLLGLLRPDVGAVRTLGLEPRDA